MDIDKISGVELTMKSYLNDILVFEYTPEDSEALLDPSWPNLCPVRNSALEIIEEEGPARVNIDNVKAVNLGKDLPPS